MYDRGAEGYTPVWKYGKQWLQPSLDGRAMHITHLPFYYVTGIRNGLKDDRPYWMIE